MLDRGEVENLCPNTKYQISEAQLSVRLCSEQRQLRRGCRAVPEPAASAIPPAGVSLCSDRHSCGGEGSVSGKHPWSHTGPWILPCSQLSPSLPVLAPAVPPTHTHPRLPALQEQPQAPMPCQRSPQCHQPFISTITGFFT